ncbi:hypothetical protein [Larkinella sp. C7]|uniref:hypothetical protein n=1 Tax=Larkinella sp. C7 TaxID=2576607 RepID=UPI0011112954|nr:hypothetical protein [Larkinella sp. C7]
MSYINLKLIGELEEEADQMRTIAETQSYGWEKDRPLDSVTYMGLIKASLQGQNLFKQLKSLHEVCTDFAAGNFQKYEEEFYQDADEGEVYDPIEDIRYHFARNTVYSLPPTIEQYADLMAVVSQYARIKATKREGFAKFFGNIQRGYLATDTDGTAVIVPTEEIPESVLNEIEVNREIKEIEVEYCLDKYNDFYQSCTSLIEIHACSAKYDTEKESAQGLAVNLLGYFEGWNEPTGLDQ